jgi:hypothetical protein
LLQPGAKMEILAKSQYIAMFEKRYGRRHAAFGREL